MWVGIGEFLEEEGLGVNSTGLVSLLLTGWSWTGWSHSWASVESQVAQATLGQDFGALCTLFQYLRKGQEGSGILRAQQLLVSSKFNDS